MTDVTGSTTDRAFDRNTGQSIGYLLRDVSRRILRRHTERLEAEHGITLPQCFVLRELWQREGLTQRELANRVGVLEPAMVATIDSLVALELIERERSSSDRRKIHIRLTERGRALEDPALAISADVLEAALAGSTREEIETVRAVLARVKQNYEDEAAT